MASRFDTMYQSQALPVLFDQLGESITYRVNSTGVEKSITAVINRAPHREGVGVRGPSPIVVAIKKSDVPTVTVTKDTVTVDGVTHRIEKVVNGGGGQWTLSC